MNGITQSGTGNLGIELPAVLGGGHTWRPQGPVEWWQWGGTKPTWDTYLNALDPNAVPWPMRTPGGAAALTQAYVGEWAHDGPIEREVEQTLRDTKGVLDVAMCSSGTAALWIMYKALMAWARLHGRAVVGKPQVIMTKMTFQATAAAAVAAGLEVVMVDIEPGTLTPSTDTIRAAITDRTVGIVDVPIYNVVPPLDERRALADEFGLWYGVDGAQGMFARYGGGPVDEFAHGVSSSTQYGKDPTSGEGGCVSSNIPLAAALMRTAIVGKEPAILPEWWPTDELDRLRAITPGRVAGLQGDNVRFNEFQAAVLLDQLKLQPAQWARKLEQYRRLRDGLTERGLPFRLVKGDAFLYKVALWNDTPIDTAAALDAARIQMTGEWGPPYIPMDDPASGFKPQTVPWQSGYVAADDLLVPADTDSVAALAHRKVMLLAGNELLRADAANHVLDTLTGLAAYPHQINQWWADTGHRS
jgi:dTDP-4-amino-4,6-dideoxygalactose transaminase